MYLRSSSSSSSSSSSLILLIVTLLVSTFALPCMAVGAEPATQSTQSDQIGQPSTESLRSRVIAELAAQRTQSNQSANPAPKVVKASGRWPKKKITKAIIVGCVIATAIAVPVAVSLYHRHEVHIARARDANQRTMAQFILCKQQVIASRQEQAINALLHQGPLLNPAQQAILKADLSQVQQAEANLKVLYNDVLLKVPLPSIIAMDNGIVGSLRGANLNPVLNAIPSNTNYPTRIYTLEYDGFADFPKYPINGLSDLNSILGIFYLH